MQTCAECLMCLLTREMASVPRDTPAHEKLAHLRDAMCLLGGTDMKVSTPEIGLALSALHQRRFGDGKQLMYANVKRLYNTRMTEMAPTLRAALGRASDPLAAALKLARAGNYIDFGASHVVADTQLDELIRNADAETLDAAEYEAFRRDMGTARRMVYVTDNAGEIVLDGLLIEQILIARPDMQLTVLVRGGFVLNDATVEDAHEVGLDAMVPVMGNGNAMPGTVWSALSPAAQALLREADMIVAKGQANFETMGECGLNVYYLLLCKCDYFVRRFGVPRLTGMFVNDRRLPPMEA